jgi:hypothetical protein
LEEAQTDEIKAYKEWMDSERPLVESEGRFVDHQTDLVSLRKKTKEGMVVAKERNTRDVAVEAKGDGQEADILPPSISVDKEVTVFTKESSIIWLPPIGSKG